MRCAIERDNPQLAGVLPKTYRAFDARLLKELLKTFSTIPVDLEGDSFGKIYEYFLAEFAMAEGQGGGEFYTPTSIVRLLVEIVEPFKGRVLDPACGSGGIFVQGAPLQQARNFLAKSVRRPLRAAEMHVNPYRRIVVKAPRAARRVGESP